MKLMTCPSCHRVIESSSGSCPACGQGDSRLDVRALAAGMVMVAIVIGFWIAVAKWPALMNLMNAIWQH